VRGWYCARVAKAVVVVGLMRVLVSSARLNRVRVADIYVVGRMSGICTRVRMIEVRLLR